MRFVSKTEINEFDKNHKIKNAFGPGLRPDIWKNMIDRFGNIHFAELYGSSEGIVGLYNIGTGCFDCLRQGCFSWEMLILRSR